jgi:hypothetical protein
VSRWLYAVATRFDAPIPLLLGPPTLLVHHLFVPATGTSARAPQVQELSSPKASMKTSLRMFSPRRLALTAFLGLALLGPAQQAFAIVCTTTVTRYYLFGYEVWSSTERSCTGTA